MLPLIPAWPDPKSEAGEVFFANARAIFAAWKARGESNAFSLAMLTQAEADSGLNPKALGDHDTAYGLHLWHGDRVAAIKARTGIDLKTFPPIADQIAAAGWEIENLKWLGGAAMRNAPTARAAAIQACASFEPAGAPDAAERRGQMAER